MMQQGNFVAAAVIGLVLLSDGQTLIDLGTVARASMKDNGTLDLHLHGQSTMERLHGDDAKAVWKVLTMSANDVASILEPDRPVVPSGTFAQDLPPTTDPVAMVDGNEPLSLTGGEPSIPASNDSKNATDALNPPATPSPSLTSG